MEKAQKYSDVELGYLPSLPLGKALIYHMSLPSLRRCTAATCGALYHRKMCQLLDIKVRHFHLQDVCSLHLENVL